MTQARQPRKSAIKAPPLPYPGRSLQDQVHALLHLDVMLLVTACVFVMLAAVAEWVLWLLDAPRHPVAYTLVALSLMVYGYWRFVGIRSRVRPMLKGIEGEQAVGQFLDDHVRVRGYRVLHDLVQEDGDGSRFNIDHVLIGPGGVYALETKVRSKPAAGDAEIVCEGDTVSVDGRPPDRAPIRQAQASARRVRELLVELTGRTDVFVRPVVLFPGWYVKGRPADGVTWVLSGRELPAWLDRAPHRLSDEDIALYFSRLASLLRQAPARR